MRKLVHHGLTQTKKVNCVPVERERGEPGGPASKGYTCTSKCNKLQISKFETEQRLYKLNSNPVFKVISRVFTTVFRVCLLARGIDFWLIMSQMRKKPRRGAAVAAAAFTAATHRRKSCYSAGKRKKLVYCFGSSYLSCRIHSPIIITR